MKIIIEGCDGVGKTTLAETLAHTLNGRVEHDSEPKTYNEYMERLNQKGVVIFDRFFLGQFVYNKQEDRKMTRQELLKLTTYCLSRKDVLLLYLEMDTAKLLERLASRNKIEQEKDIKMFEKMGLKNLKEYIEVTKTRYQKYTKKFKKISGE
jgi:thymidylate kinase